MKITIRPSFPSFISELHVGSGFLTRSQLLPYLGKGKIVVVADAAVQHLYGEPLAREIDAELLSIPGGERNKTKERADFLIDALSQKGVGKDGTLIAVGGGGTTDLVGFVASIYLRGISLLLIPTTLLAMVDASIGGKTAIDTPYGKNQIGTLYPPKAIFVDFNTLKTLPKKEKFNGLAEMLKMGLIYDRSIWEDREPILPSIQAKISVIEQDPTEKGLRRILNFGHTIGHALETVANYAIPHGEAVALGCLVESHLSMRLGYLAGKDFALIEAKFNTFSLPLPVGYDRAKFVHALSRDKKNAAGKIRFVLIDQIGHAIPFDGDYCRAVSLEELEDTLDWMEKRC